jgi:PAS domain-containing protein
MHSVPRSGPGEPASRPSDFVNGEVRGLKRKRAGTPTSVSLGVEASGSPSKERIRLLSGLQRRLPVPDNLETLWEDMLEVFDEARPSDTSFALLYSVHDKWSEHVDLETTSVDEDEASLSPKQLALEGLVGLDGSSSDASLLCQLLPQELCKEPQFVEPCLLLMDPNGALHRAMVLVALHTKPLVDSLVLCPIFAHDTAITALLVLGVNSQSYDDDFRMFAHVLSASVGRSVSTMLLRQKLKDITMASETLLRRAEEAERSNFMFRHMAESATVGCAIFDPAGHPMWLNDAYLNLTGVPKENFRPGIWQKAIVPEDLPEVEGRWNKLASGEPIVPFTFRVKRHHNPTAKPGSCESLDYRWLLSNAYVDFSEDGSCRRVMGWLTDISAQKWNEHLQAERLADALETKRQTEKFIDMVRVGP